MTPSEFKAQLFGPKSARLKHELKCGKVQIQGSDPLGCSPVPVLFLLKNNALQWASHSGSHPASVKCFWSGREISQDMVGETPIFLEIVYGN